MTDKFTWHVLANISGGGDFTVVESKFGDGYAQNTVIGLNNEVQKWSATTTGFTSEIAAPLAFIRAHKGLSFLWTPPLGVEGYYTCKSYKPTNQGGSVWTLTMEFEQVFFP